MRCLLAFVFLTSAAFAQDERRVISPDGTIEFRLFVATQEDSNLPRIAYRVNLRNEPILGISFLGLDILDQVPLLGENDGLTSSSSSQGKLYNSLTAKYMQNGSLGRLITIEVRAYNEGVAFRYVIPPSTPLMELLLAEEATEFHFEEKIDDGPLQHLKNAWVAISESKPGSFPPMHLTLSDPTTELTRLSRLSDARIAFEGTTPLTCPWRIIAIGQNRDSVLKSGIAADLANAP